MKSNYVKLGREAGWRIITKETTSVLLAKRLADLIVRHSLSVPPIWVIEREVHARDISAFHREIVILGHVVVEGSPKPIEVHMNLWNRRGASEEGEGSWLPHNDVTLYQDWDGVPFCEPCNPNSLLANEAWTEKKRKEFR